METPQTTVIRRRKQVLTLPVGLRGQATFERHQMPHNAVAITGVGVVVRAKGGTFADALPVFLYGSGEVLPQSGAGFSQGVFATIGGLTKATYVGEASATAYLFYAHPAHLPAPIFDYECFNGGFVEATSFWATVTHNNVTQSMPFRCWQSVTPNLGRGINLIVTHP